METTVINLYGSPCGTFSDDLKIIEYKTKFDFVNLFKGFNTKNNNYNLKILNGYGHSFDIYNEGLKEIKQLAYHKNFKIIYTFKKKFLLKIAKLF